MRKERAFWPWLVGGGVVAPLLAAALTYGLLRLVQPTVEAARPAAPALRSGVASPPRP